MGSDPRHPDAPPSALDQLGAEQLAKLAGATAALVEVTTSYQAQLKAAGFSDTAAEAMAVQFHGMMLAEASKATR